MKFSRDMSSVDTNERKNFTIGEGEHTFYIESVEDRYTRNGDPMAVIKLVCCRGDQDAGKWTFDNIIFPEPGSPAAAITGRSKQFLYCLGEPYEGFNVDIDTERWINKRVVGNVVIEPKNEYHKFDKAVVTNYEFVEGLNEIPTSPTIEIEPTPAEDLTFEM